MAYPQQPGYPPGTNPQGQPAYYGAPPPAYASGTVTVVAQPFVTVAQQYRETPIRTKCPHCSADIVTATTYTTGTFAWVVCLILCFVGCDLGCCFIPFCVNSCKDCIHSCPNCKQQLGVYRRM